MTVFGQIGFVAPWILVGLIALPVVAGLPRQLREAERPRVTPGGGDERPERRQCREQTDDLQVVHGRIPGRGVVERRTEMAGGRQGADEVATAR